MSELFPARTIALQYISIAEALHENEFLRWYQTNEWLKTDGIAAVTLYRNLKENLKDGQPRYLTVYRLDVEDPPAVINTITQKSLPDGLNSLQVGIWDFLALRTSVRDPLRPAVRLPDGMPAALLAVPTICTDPAREKEFNDWYLYTHFHDILETPGLTQAHRYRNLNPQPRADEAQYMALYEIDAEDPATVVRQIEHDDRAIRIPQGRMIDCIRPA